MVDGNSFVTRSRGQQVILALLLRPDRPSSINLILIAGGDAAQPRTRWTRSRSCVVRYNSKPDSACHPCRSSGSDIGAYHLHRLLPFHGESATCWSRASWLVDFPSVLNLTVVLPSYLESPISIVGWFDARRGSLSYLKTLIRKEEKDSVWWRKEEMERREDSLHRSRSSSIDWRRWLCTYENALYDGPKRI
jgi:hypothetical protein